MRSKELAERIGITEQNVSLLKSGKVKGVRFDTLALICETLDCQPAIFSSIATTTTAQRPCAARAAERIILANSHSILKDTVAGLSPAPVPAYEGIMAGA